MTLTIDALKTGRIQHVHAGAAVCSPSITAKEVDASTWNAMLNDFDDVSFEQCATFAAGLWGKERTSHLAVFRDGELIGGACVVTFALPVAPSGISYIKHGPIWRRSHCLPAVENYHAVLSALIAEYGERRGQGIVIVPRPNPAAAGVEQKILDEHGFSVRRSGTDPNRFLVNVTLDEKAQLQSIGQKWRYNLRAAIKNGVEVVEATDEQGIADFASLHAAMVARKKFADRDPIDLIPAMIADLPARLRPRIFLARHRGQAVAGAVVGVHGDTAYYLFGASNESALSLNAGYALHWSIVAWLRTEAAYWYDLGGEAGEQGLRQFKKGLVGKRGAIVVMNGEYEYARGLSAQFSVNAIMAVRRLRRVLSGWLACLLA